MSKHSFHPLSGSKDTVFDVQIERPDEEKMTLWANECKEKRITTIDKKVPETYLSQANEKEALSVMIYKAEPKKFYEDQVQMNQIDKQNMKADVKQSSYKYIFNKQCLQINCFNTKK